MERKSDLNKSRYPANKFADVIGSVPKGMDTKRTLGAILAEHNGEHSTKNKTVSIKTMHERKLFYFKFFAELRAETQYYRADPRELQGRHVQVMVDRWVARGLATGTIHVYLSYLRTLCRWTNREGMVLEPAHYLGDKSAHAHRKQVTTKDKSWSAAGIDVEAKIAEIAEMDEIVGLQLELCIRFAMRGKEARFFRPHEAVLARSQANEQDAECFPDATHFVRVEYGTKGGRPRDVPLATEQQRELLTRLKEKFGAGRYVGYPHYTAEQAENRFLYVLRRCGVSKKKDGVTAHGLRHEALNDLFEAEAGVPSPVRGGPVTKGNVETDQARLTVARYAGHGRHRATSAYLGGTPLGRRLKRETAAAGKAEASACTKKPKQAGDGGA